MDFTSPTLRRAFALAVGGAGILVAWLALEPAGLLVAVAAFSLWLGARAGLIAMAVTTSLWAAIVFTQPVVGIDSAVRLAVFVVAAGAIWLLVQVFKTSNLFDVLDQDTRGLVVDIPGLGWGAYPDGRLRFVNPAVLSFIGLTAEELERRAEVEDSPLEFWTHPDDQERIRVNWERALAAGQPLVDEQRVLRHDGVYRWFRDTIVPSRDKRGRITGWYGLSTDITDQKVAEEGLRQSERELRVLVDTVPTMIYLTNPEGRPYYFNKRFKDWVGADPGGVPTPIVDGVEPYAIFIHPDDLVAAQTAIYSAFSKGEPLQYRNRLRRIDGQYRWVDSRVEPLRDENGTIIRWYGVIIDIDDEVRAQESLRLADERLSRASRAASLSELSVSIAHELNSPLQAVVANANAFQRWLSATPPNYERAGRTAERIIRDANAAADVINHIRSLFAQSAQGRTPVDLNGIVTEVCELLADRLQSNGVRLELALAPGLPLTMVDRVQIEQVVVNLVRNAIEAMLEVAAPARVLRITTRQNDDGTLTVDITDRGEGISDPERIFEAFYTTKKDGMGMGLAICRSIIESHEGRISVTSELGQGSSVLFTLPVASEADARVGE